MSTHRSTLLAERSPHTAERATDLLPAQSSSELVLADPNADPNADPKANANTHPTASVLPPVNTRVSLSIGARFACFYCRNRNVSGARCGACGRRRIELIGHAANSRLVQVARRVKSASEGEPKTRPHDGVFRSIAHTTAIVFAALGGFFAQHFPQSHGDSQFFLTMLGILLGAASGYLAMALLVVFVMLLGGAVALVVALVSLVVFGGLQAIIFPLAPSKRWQGLSKRLDSTLQSILKRIFHPVFLLHGMWQRPQWRPKERHEALTPIVPTIVPFVRRPTDAPDVSFEGTITQCQPMPSPCPSSTVALGVMGDTVGTWVQDAIITPFTLTTTSGEQLQVVITAGELSLFAKDAQRREPPLSDTLGAYATQFGIARAKRKPELIPPAKSLEHWSVLVGQRVRIEGGAMRQQMSNTAASGYRESAFRHELHGDAEHPIRVTVLGG